MATIESINEKLRIAAESLDSAAEEIRDLPFEPTTQCIRNIGKALGAIFEIQHNIYQQYPNLRPEFLNEESPIPDPDLTEAQKATVASLSQDQINAIDNLLISHATNNWRKVAMLVGLAMSDSRFTYAGVPDVFLAQRVRNLVELKQLEAQGNLQFMRYSEVQLPNAKT